MSCIKWTDEEVQILIDNLQFDHHGFTKNKKEMMSLLPNRSKSSISTKITYLRKIGKLPGTDLDDPITPHMRPYSKYEDKIIIDALRAGTSCQEIADTLGRSYSAVTTKLSRLRKKRADPPYKTRSYTDDEVKVIMESIRFDEFGFANNTDELAKMLSRSRLQMGQKIANMRKAGLIKIKPNRTKSGISSNTRETFGRENELCFVFNSKKEPTPVPASVDQM